MKHFERKAINHCRKFKAVSCVLSWWECCWPNHCVGPDWNEPVVDAIRMEHWAKCFIMVWSAGSTYWQRVPSSSWGDSRLLQESWCWTILIEVASSNTTRIWGTHKAVLKGTGGFHQAQNIVLLMLVTPENTCGSAVLSTRSCAQGMEQTGKEAHQKRRQEERQTFQTITTSGLSYPWRTGLFTSRAVQARLSATGNCWCFT